MKLAKLPDRTPVKMNIVLTPSLAKRLREYADLYAEIYGSREEVAELIPFMLESFLNSDAEYKKAKGRDDPQKKSGRTDRMRDLSGGTSGSPLSSFSRP